MAVVAAAEGLSFDVGIRYQVPNHNNTAVSTTGELTHNCRRQKGSVLQEKERGIQEKSKCQAEKG